MTETELFEAERSHLRAVAYRLLGSASDADDALQEAWLRLDRSDTSEVDNLAAWLTTVVARVSLDMLRSRRARRDQPAGVALPEPPADDREADPEAEALLADSVGNALLVVLDRLTPAERVAFVLHDSFGVPFAEIAPIVGRSPSSAKKLASRARQKVRGNPRAPEADLARQRQVVEAFLAAARAGDIAGLLAVLDPNVVRRADAVALPAGPAELRGGRAVAEQTRLLSERARFAELALVDGAVGVLLAPRGQLRLALTFKVSEGRISRYDVIADPARLAQLALALP
jgi:RNA polymerase sigma-70 factor (ECF subfamily)